MPVHNVSELTGVSDHKIWRVLDSYIDLAKKNENYSDISIIGMDETSIARKHEYITLFIDLVERKTLHISASKDNQKMVDFVDILEAKSGDRKAIKQVSWICLPRLLKALKKTCQKQRLPLIKSIL